MSENSPQSSQQFCSNSKFSIVDYSESEESDADLEDKKEPIIKSLTKKTNKPKVARKRILKNISNLNGKRW